jgi:hypothetical protein
MRVLKLITYVSILIITLSSVTSCNEGCSSQLTPNRQVKVTFGKKTGLNIYSDSTIGKVYIFGNDKPFYNDLPASKVSLELNPNSDSTMFLLKTDSLSSVVIDSLIFSYKTELVLLSSECGFNTSFNDFKLKKYTKHRIDTVIIQTEDINSEVTSNYRVIMKRDTTRR